MPGYDLYGEVLAHELQERFRSPEFQQRVSLFGLLRGRGGKRRSERAAQVERRGAAR